MSATRTRRTSETDDEVPRAPQTTPRGVSTGMPGHDFTLQAIIELQKSIGEMNATVAATKSSVDGLKTKVDELVAWKNKILGGAAVLAAVVAILGFLLGKASDYVTLRSPPATGVQQPEPLPQATPPTK